MATVTVIACEWLPDGTGTQMGRRRKEKIFKMNIILIGTNKIFNFSQHNHVIVPFYWKNNEKFSHFPCSCSLSALWSVQLGVN